MLPGDSTGRAPFPSTVWSEVLHPGRLEALCRKYWKPVFAYIRVSWPGTRLQDAEDLTQAFFARLLEKRTIDRATPLRGSFRAYLKTALRHFLIDAHRAARPIPIPEIRASEAAYDREWFLGVVRTCLDRLRAELERQKKPLYFEAFRLCCLKEPPLPYRRIAERLGLRESDVVNYLGYSRKLARRFLREELEASGEPGADEVMRSWLTNP
jgi:RNA polymerase sigma-70 factor (ECF subfamily)